MFREEDVLVSDYTMILISLLLESYNLKFSSSVQLSLTHLIRIVTTKSQLFLKSTKSRIIPRLVDHLCRISMLTLIDS